MKFLMIVLFAASSFASASEINLNAGDVVEVDANVKTKVTCSLKHSTAPYSCRLNIKDRQVQLVMTKRAPLFSSDFDPIVLLTREFRLDSSADAEVVNQRSLTVISDELNSLVSKGICVKI